MRILSGIRNRRGTMSALSRAASGTARAWASMRSTENPAQQARLVREKQALKKNAKKFERDSSRYKLGTMKAGIAKSLLNICAFVMSFIVIVWVLSNRVTFSGGVWVRRHLLADSTYVHTASGVRDVDGTSALQAFLKNTLMKVLFAENPDATSEIIHLDHTKNKDMQRRCEQHVKEFRKEDSYMTLRPMDQTGEIYLFDGVLIRQLRGTYGGPFDGFTAIRDEFEAADNTRIKVPTRRRTSNTSAAGASKFAFNDNHIPQVEMSGQIRTYDVSEGFDVFFPADMPFSKVTDLIDSTFNMSAAPPWVDSSTVAVVIMAKFYMPESPNEWRCVPDFRWVRRHNARSQKKHNQPLTHVSALPSRSRQTLASTVHTSSPYVTHTLTESSAGRSPGVLE